MPIALLPGPSEEEEPPRLFCTFRLGDQLFGVDVADVKEVNPETTLTRIHHAPPQVLGYVNLRGQIYLVLDLRRLLGLPAGPIGPESRLVIFKPRVGDALAGLVDRIGDIVAVQPSRIELRGPLRDAVEIQSPNPETEEEGPAPMLDGGLERVHTGGELIGGVAQLDEELLLILQAGQFLRVVEDVMAR